MPREPDLGEWPVLNPGAEIVMAHDHIIQENAGRVAFLKSTPPVAQLCALAGSIQWSMFRGLQVRQLYFGVRCYFVPMYLANREDITRPPDLVAPVQLQQDKLLVRTALIPDQAYARARVTVGRQDQLPSWLIASWQQAETKIAPPVDERGIDEEGDGDDQSG